MALSRREAKRGRRVGREAARMPMLSSTSFQMLKALLKRMSRLVKKEERRYSFIIPEAHAA